MRVWLSKRDVLRALLSTDRCIRKGAPGWNLAQLKMLDWLASPNKETPCIEVSWEKER